MSASSTATLGASTERIDESIERSLQAAALPAVVLGGSGYVAGELLRILVGHPRFRISAVTSESRAGELVTEAFPHLRGTALDGHRFAAADGASQLDRIDDTVGPLAIFSALPHGEAASRIDTLLSEAESAHRELRVVDLSADFRHRSADDHRRIYGKPHPAPHRLEAFRCALPDLERGSPTTSPHVAHPGCFTTAATLALAPLVAGGWIDPRSTVTVVAVTGSTGAGRTPTATTHHPERRSDLFAYSPLAHRHEPEIRALLAPLASAPGEGSGIDLVFLPHSGPFARGIHATITAKASRPTSAADLEQFASSFYGSLPRSVSAPTESQPVGGEASHAAASPFTESLSSLPVSSSREKRPSASFVQILDGPPRLQAVVGTNRCDLSYAMRGSDIVAFAAIDNLVKGAAGGAVQWMNLLFGLDARTGLELPGLGWL